MARRPRKSPAEGFVAFAARFPWWLCLVLAVISYAVLQAYVQTPAPVVKSTADVGNNIFALFFRSAALFGQIVLPLLFLVAAVLSVIAQRKQRRSHDLHEDGLSGQPSARHTGMSSRSGPESATPECPLCGTRMVKRRSHRGTNAGAIFWGCAHFPECKGTRSLT